mmetsp:Transcript_102818/g.329785  ORF Transcript_102818/g.329785 Transcript_102818/m.329785 type:complete len:231 (+) Transcript_102818:296-988(+)
MRAIMCSQLLRWRCGSSLLKAAANAAQSALGLGPPSCANAATTRRQPHRLLDYTEIIRAALQQAMTSSSSTSRSRSTCAGCAAAWTTTWIQLGSRNRTRCRRTSPVPRASHPMLKSCSAELAAPRQPTRVDPCFATSRGAACPGVRGAWGAPCGSIRNSRRCRTRPWRSTSRAYCKAQDVRHCPGYNLTIRTWARPEHPGNLPMSLPNSSPHVQSLPQRHRPPKRQPSLA